MYAEERQRTIVSLALRYDRVAVTELAQRFDVTTETIRRDLMDMEVAGELKRVRGGAVPMAAREDTTFGVRITLRAPVVARTSANACQWSG